MLCSRYYNIILAFVMGLAVMQSIHFFNDSNNSSDSRLRPPPSRLRSPYHRDETRPILRNPSDHYKCRFYMAESAVAPNSGLGMFAGVGLLAGETVGFPDICLYVADGPREYTHIDTHTWGWGTFFGQYEGALSRAACEGYATIFNTMPYSHVNTRMIGPVQATTAGLKRTHSPGAGGITHYFGIHAETIDVVPAGGELTLDYGDWEFDEEAAQDLIRPQRTLSDLEENGWCIDYMEVRQSTIQDAGRGSFVKQALPKGTVVTPMPLQLFNDRKHFQHVKPEQLYVNYCLQPANSRMLIFPYGPGFGLINHSSKHANVKLQWSTNKAHKGHLLELDYNTFWEKIRPGNLILETVTTRDLQPGEELLLDYGPAWEAAWKQHVKKWKAPKDAEQYVYPEDMDDTDTLRTVEEQKDKPYPNNLISMCHTPDVERNESNHVEWYGGEWEWAETMFYCHILDRSRSESGDFEYVVELIFFADYQLMEKDLAFDPTKAFRDRYVDSKVPRRAIRWAEKPYVDDEHLENAFRHPIELPGDLVPDAWITET